MCKLCKSDILQCLNILCIRSNYHLGRHDVFSLLRHLVSFLSVILTVCTQFVYQSIVPDMLVLDVTLQHGLSVDFYWIIMVVILLSPYVVHTSTAISVEVNEPFVAAAGQSASPSHRARLCPSYTPGLPCRRQSTILPKA